MGRGAWATRDIKGERGARESRKKGKAQFKISEGVNRGVPGSYPGHWGQGSWVTGTWVTGTKFLGLKKGGCRAALDWRLSRAKPTTFYRTFLPAASLAAAQTLNVHIIIWVEDSDEKGG